MRCLLRRVVCRTAAALRCRSRDPPVRALGMASPATLSSPADDSSGSSAPVRAPSDASPPASQPRRQRSIAGSAAFVGNKRWKKSRPWQQRRQPEEAARDAGQEASEVADGDAAPAEKRPRLGSKRKVALLVAYNGSGYQGLQIQTGSEQRTIEAELSRAIHNAGGMLASNLPLLSKVSWQRCARTDKGVHAACNVISLQLIVDPSRSIVPRINALLPPAIRVLSCLPVMGSFHAKHSCTSRVYHYLVPTYLFDPSISEHIDIEKAKRRGREDEQRRLLHFQLSQQQHPARTQSPRPVAESDDDGAEEEQAEADSEAEAGAAQAAEQADEAIIVSDAYRQRLLSYRLPRALRSAVEAALRRFEGSHNFYNFTRHKSIRNREDKREQTGGAAVAELKAENESAPQQPSRRPGRWQHAAGPLLPVNRDFQADRNMRCILSCGIAQTFVHAQTGLELAVLRVHGQSFMLNQIRKMVAAAVLIARGIVDGDELLLRVFAERGVYLPTAPSLGLYLDRPLFELYDQRCQRLQQDDSDRRRDGVAAAEANGQPPIQRKTVQQLYDELDAGIQAFRRDHIYPGICEEESSGLSAYRWLAGISLHPSLWPTETAEQPGPPPQQSTQSE